MSGFPRLLLVGLALVAWAPPARAQEGWTAAPPVQDTPVGFLGPTGAVQLSPIRQALIDVSARAQVASMWLRVERHTANVWNSDTPVRVGASGRALHTQDVHLEQWMVDAGLPLGRWAAVGVRWGSGRLWGGGEIDRSIELFHADYDFYNFSREKAPKARTLLHVEGTGSPTVHWDGPRPLVPSPQLSAFARVLENATTQLLLRGTLQLPLGDLARRLELNGPETAVGASLFRRFRQVAAVYVAGHLLAHGNARLGGLPVEPQVLLEASLEWRLLPFLTVLMEDRLQSPLFYGRYVRYQEDRALPPRTSAMNGYFTPVNIITGGARVYLPHNSAVTMHVGEDFMFCVQCYRDRFSRETNAPDISLSLTLEQVLPARAL